MRGHPASSSPVIVPILSSERRFYKAIRRYRDENYGSSCDQSTGLRRATESPAKTATPLPACDCCESVRSPYTMTLAKTRGEYRRRPATQVLSGFPLRQVEPTEDVIHQPHAVVNRYRIIKPLWKRDHWVSDFRRLRPIRTVELPSRQPYNNANVYLRANRRISHTETHCFNTPSRHRRWIFRPSEPENAQLETRQRGIRVL
jgi:hypothetical protein